MNETREQLVSLLKERMLQISDSQIDALIRDAQEEALTDVKAIIKEAMVQAVLERAMDGLGAKFTTSPPVREAASNPPEPLSPAPSPTPDAEVMPETRSDVSETTSETESTENKEALEREIETIKRKIAENESLLREAEAEVEAEAEDKVKFEGKKGDGAEGCGYYLYAIVNDGHPLDDKLPCRGIAPDYPVYALPYRDVQAVVSQVPLCEFGQKELEANLEDMGWVEAKVCAHQDVLENVLATCPLVPMRFCTIYKSEDRVLEMLGQYYNGFTEALKRFTDKQEWGVKVYCDEEALSHSVRGVSERVDALQAEMEQKSSGAAYFLKKKLEKTIAEEVERVSDRYAQESHDRLLNYSETSVIGSLQSKDITGRAEVMVLNGAYLVTDEQLPAFRREIECLGEEYGEYGFVYEMTGPWPPYNFVEIGCEEMGYE